MRSALCAMVATVAAITVPLHGQNDDAVRASTTLRSLESLLDWPAPEPALSTDVRVMTRSALAFVPLPLIRLTSHDDAQVVASVTEWQARDQEPPPAGRAFAFAHPPVACTDDRALCAGAPQEMRGPEVKALWFALMIARSCNDRPRAARSDAEDLFVRGRLNGMSLQVSCRGPNLKGATPGDRQAAAVLRIAHHLLGR